SCFDSNVALSSGAVYAHLGTITLRNCTFSQNIGQGGLAGAMLVEDSRSVEVLSSIFRHNYAESGSALVCRNCELSLLSNCSFYDNEAGTHSGGALYLYDGTAAIYSSLFVRNTARTDGGAIAADQIRNLSILDNTFDANSASTGGGSSIWLSSSPRAHVTGNIFEDNSAPQGGGTVYWKSHTDMKEPFNISRTNSFADSNAALYGSSVATDSYDLKLSDQNYYTVSDYTTYIPPVTVYVVDYYGTVVASESQYQIVAQLLSGVQCHDSTAGFVTGGFIEQLSNGVAVFDSLLASCDPGYNMSVDLTCSLPDETLQTFFLLSFRDCVRGEYFGESACIQCEEGTYSLTDPATASLDDLGKQVCQPCPDGSSSCRGDVIELEEGYWRISETATTTLKCPHRDSCGGGSDTGDALCLDGYEG
ncbi:unnamed protein product, partial [Ectocarpus fasciculatus]